MSEQLSPRIPIKLILGLIFCFAAPLCTAQLVSASPPIANHADTRFVGVTEDFTTPSLKTSHLLPADPLLSWVNDYPGYTEQLNQVQWRWGDPLDLYVIKPKGIKKPPAIIYLYSYPYDTDYFKSDAWEEAVTKDGFAAIGFVTALTGHRYHDRPWKQWFVSELRESLAISAHDIQLVMNYLETRGDLDMSRVGVFAEGSGASIAILASAVDPRIKVLDLVAPWGDWPTWLRTSPFVPENERPEFMKPDFLKKVAALDPVDWLSKVQAKKTRLQEVVFDSTTPEACRQKLHSAVPAGTSVVVYETPQQFNTARNHNQVMSWIHTELNGLRDQEAKKPAEAMLQNTSRSSPHPR